MEQPLFLNKYQSLYFKDFETDDETIDILQTLINMNNLNILFIGDIGSGKTTFLNATIKEYYKAFTYNQYKDNILHINSLKNKVLTIIAMMLKHFVRLVLLLTLKKKLLF